MISVLWLALFAAVRVPAIAHGWIAYEMATTKPVTMCCERCCDKTSERQALDVFAYYESGRVGELLLRSPACPPRTHETITWIREVSPEESREFLRRVIADGVGHAESAALLALSLQAGGTDDLIDIANHNPDPHLRGQALFWLAQQAGEKAAAALRNAVDNDPEESVRARAVFGIAQLPNDQSIPMLIDLLEHNRSRKVRKQAAFWLGQKDDPRALAAIEEILRR